ncbi:asparagine-linked glycosylation protein [Balamuthia mandrillaris]
MKEKLLLLLVGAVALAAVSFLLWCHYQRSKLQRRRQKLVHDSNDPRTIFVAFFHPYCNAGGGGERVLWCGIKAIQEMTDERVQCVVYTGDEVEGREILQKAKTRFGITLEREVRFVHLQKRSWVEASSWPRFTMIGQSLGSMVLGYEALSKLPPHLFIDTMGYSFTFPLFSWLAGAVVACYVHYPTISSDMIEKVGARSVKAVLKHVYYRFFAALYARMGRFASLVLVNSKWTASHINSLWNNSNNASTNTNARKAIVVYPPCDVEERRQLPFCWEERWRRGLIVSVAQFRPEKNHALQLEAFAHMLKACRGKEGIERVHLALVGSCRGDEDRERLERLRQQAEALGIQDKVEFCVDVPYAALQKKLSEALIGLHTMWCEHFGIGIVEMMAAGVITIAHNSGGPREDIIQAGVTGYLATEKEEYAEHMRHILFASDKTAQEELEEMQKNARASVDRFSDEEFHNRFCDAFRPILSSLL